MSNNSRLFLADSCIGGLSVLKSLWRDGRAHDAVFLADYQCNPLGQKQEAEIANVAERWATAASRLADTLLIACNTMSVRYHKLRQSGVELPAAGRVVSMVDGFEAMIEAEKQHLVNRKVLVVGTEYTASQSLYPELLRAQVAAVSVTAIAATELERRIARLMSWDVADDEVLTAALRSAIEVSDVVVLACTCFPMATTELKAIYPDVVFLDPGEYFGGLIPVSFPTSKRQLQLTVTGNIVSKEKAEDFAKTYLASESVNL